MGVGGGEGRQPSRYGWWPLCKSLAGLLIIGCVGWQFWRILNTEGLWHATLKPRWALLVGSGVAYLSGLGFSVLFWFRLLKAIGERPTGLATVRAYFVGQLARYVPGKALGVIVRARLLKGPGVRPGVAALTVVYESLTTMAAGALLAATLFALTALEAGENPWKALGLLLIVGIPILPTIFNPLVAKMAARFRQADAPPMPLLGWPTLAEGIALATCGWAVQGLSLWFMVNALSPESIGWSFGTWQRYTANLALAYVAGFLVVFVPSGMGVRELMLQQFLTAELAVSVGHEETAGLAVVIVLYLRLVFTASELLAAGVAYWLPTRGPRFKK